MTRPDDTDNTSAEALVVARDLCNRLGLADQFNGPYPGDVRVISLALDRFRAAGVREERERLLLCGECVEFGCQLDEDGQP